MAEKIKKGRYNELDALRGIAAIFVLLFHYTLHRPQANLGFRFGVTGVDLFFIISGFVIFMTLKKVKDSSEFIIGRISRLYPTYWACVTFTFILICISAVNSGSRIDFVQYLVNLTMFQYYFRIRDIDGPYWTLLIEMVFYISIILIFYFKMMRFLKPIGISVAVTAAVLCFFFGNNKIVEKIFWVIPLLSFIPLFLAGIIFYEIYTVKEKLLQNYLIIALCFICQITLFPKGRSAEYITTPEYFLVLICYFSLFILFVHHKLNFIVTGVTIFLGKISYSVYLIHQYISIKVIIPYLTDTLHINFWIAALGVALPVVLILASLLTYYVDIPCRKLMKESLLKIKTWGILKKSANPQSPINANFKE
ncbi:MAG: acyltransferase [Agriterribacter sp.]